MALADGGFPKNEFVSPPGIVSPGYFWMWNAILDPGCIRSQLDDMASNGVRSVCIHPFPRDFRPGVFRTEMSPDYLTPGYMEAYKAAVDHAAKLGMNVMLYDEGGWPSGGACALVAKSDAEGRFRQRFLGHGVSGTESFGTYVHGYGNGRESYPSMIEPGASERFIQITHDRYAEHIGGHLGRTIRFAFMDEPDHPSCRPGRRLAWSSDFAEQFRLRKGYDFMPYAEDVLRTQDVCSDDGISKVRIDYYDVLGNLFVERFMLPVRDWCHRHGVLSTGHLNGEDVPELSNRYGHGPLLKCLRAMDVPGVDTIWRQLYPNTVSGEGRQAPFPRYATSAAHQNGTRYVLSESFGIYGDSMTPERMKWLVDYQMVRGVNVFVFCYYAMSNAGQWLDLFELHCGPVVPYWTFERPFFDYVARTSAMLSNGAPVKDVAVYFDEPGFRAGGGYPEIAGAAQSAVAKVLDRGNCDYDFVDHEQLAEAQIRNGRLVIGAMSYSTLVLPTSKWLPESSWKTIKAFEGAGGSVLNLETACFARPTMRIEGDARTELRVTKRRCGAETLYFVVNEGRWPVAVTLHFEEPGEVVVCERETGRYLAADADAGSLRWTFPAYDSQLFLVGRNIKHDARPRRFRNEASRVLSSGWSLRGKVRHMVGEKDFEIRPCDDVALPVELGDWRPVLGKEFSGQAVYRIEFDSEGKQRVRLDLGRVCWVCGVSLNGSDVGKRFFGPYAFDVELRQGRNILEVTVANTLANVLSDDAVRDRIARDFPPKSVYDDRLRLFDREDNESGLFGPVRLIPEE